ncbi:asparagine synthase C-terminal domain-containing protein [Gordonia malaquae]|uniref:asparagine synthase C-terminal domain-containing protein n=1 Tax=Gordonia malaquae TaxID=410332 RepID=UPI0030C79457
MPDVGVEFIDPEAVSNDYDRKAVTSSLRAALESATARPSLQGKAAGCDLSGGLDSTSIAYLLDRQGIALSLAHDVCPDPRNDDYDYARIAANDLGRPIDQLGDTRTDRDAFDAVFGGNQAGLDEAIPTWIGFGGRATRYSTYAQTSGYSDHFIGLGSDDLFSGHFSAVAEIARSSRVPEAKRALERYRIAARASKRELRKFLSSEVSYGDSLRAAVSDLRNGVDADIRISSLLGWCPGLRVNSVLSAEATTKVFEEIDLAARTTAPLDARANIHVMKSCLLTQADLVRSLNATFGSSDFRFNAPFLDSGLVELISSLPSIAFLGSDTSKPLLVDAMEGILPESIRLRRSKPDFNQDVFTDFQRNRERLRTEFRASILGEMGIIDVDKVCEIIDNDFVTIRQIDDMLAAYNTEKWLRNIDDGWVFDGSGLG